MTPFRDDPTREYCDKAYHYINEYNNNEFYLTEFDYDLTDKKMSSEGD